MTSLPEKLEGFYRFLWPDAGSANDRLELLDADLGGQPMEEILFSELRERGLNNRATVLDIGCGKGNFSGKLVTEFNCRVIAVDPLVSNLQLARQQVREQKVEFLQGRMEYMPLADRSVDWIWCFDSFNHVQGIELAFEESLRVLRPGGRIMVCSAIAPMLEPSPDLRAVCAQLSLNSDTLKQTRVETAIRSAGLKILLAESNSDERSRFFEGFYGNEARDYLRLARLVRARERFRKELGPEAYAYLHAYYLWNVFLMSGRLEYFVWLLEKEGRKIERQASV
ncbi:MAG TPA: class I SAM-dependent methyltransferase [Candidatus Obscuribacterales bacterium]